MGTGQSTVAIKQAFGFVGELYLDGPHRAQPGVIDSTGITNPNRVGRVFTATVGVDGHCGVGGAGVFFGILANPKVYPLFGTLAGGALGPSLDLPQYAPGEFVYDTTGIIVGLGAAASVGDPAFYDLTTGVISTQVKLGNAAGTGQAAIASNVMTVSALPAGQPLIGVGSVIVTAAGNQGTVVSLGSGTGGNGTYNTIGLADHSAESFTYTPIAPANGTRMPGFEVVRFNIAAAGLAVIGNIN